jgi:hypothetical protein
MWNMVFWHRRQGRFSKASERKNEHRHRHCIRRADLSEKGPCQRFLLGVEVRIFGRDAFPKRPRGRISVSIDTASACGPFGERSRPTERSLPQAKILLDMGLMQLEFFQWLMTPCPFVRPDGGRIVLLFGFLMTRHFSSRSTAKTR